MKRERARAPSSPTGFQDVDIVGDAVDPEGVLFFAGDFESTVLIETEGGLIGDFDIHQAALELPAIEDFLSGPHEQGFAVALTSQGRIEVHAVDETAGVALPSPAFDSGHAGKTRPLPAAEEEGFSASLISKQLTLVVACGFGQFGGGGGAKVIRAFLQGAVTERHEFSGVSGAQNAERGCGMHTG
jgi:hypothetical protein